MTSRARNVGTGGWAAVLLVACVITGGLTGCGGTSSTLSPPTSPSSPVSLTGNWVLTVNPTVGTVPIAVYLTSNAGTVSGIAVGPPVVDNVCPSNGCCGTPIGIFNNVALSGTIDAEGNLTLGTAANANPSATMSGSVSGSSLSNGSFAISSGSCTTQGSMTGIEYPPLDGTYAGTVTSQATGQSFMVTATLDQSSAPSSAGLLTLTGTASLSGYPCVPATAKALSANFVGNNFFLELSDSSSGILGWSGSLSPDGKTLGIDYGFSPASNACDEDYGTGTLTLQ